MKRRHFLSTSAFAGTWSLLSPLARAQGANGDLRVAVIGLNSRGGAHIDGMFSNPHFPATGPATGSFNGLHPKSNSLVRREDAREGCGDAGRTAQALERDRG